MFQFIKLGSGRAMLASVVGIEMLAILSREDGIRSVGPLSSDGNRSDVMSVTLTRR